MREHGQEYLAAYGPLPPYKRYAFECIANCRTRAMGGHRRECNHCGQTEQAYNSCGNRHCNKCQGRKRAEWLSAQEQCLLPVEYFHVVFTMPERLAAVALQNPVEVYNILFASASETLIEVGSNPRHLGARIGVLAVLHTWGQNLHGHAHVHCIIPGGGLFEGDGRWIACPKGFFLPERVLSAVYRAKFIKKLRAAYRAGRLEFHGSLENLNRPDAFAAVLDRCFNVDWVVYCKPPWGGPSQVLKYLARYTHRVAISNARLQSLSNGEVTFRWKDYANGGHWRSMTLTALEFIRRLMLHVLPKHFVKIRHYGFLANCHRRKKLKRCRELLRIGNPDDAMPAECDGKEEQSADADWGESFLRCPRCGIGQMVVVEVIRCGRLSRSSMDTS